MEVRQGVRIGLHGYAHLSFSSRANFSSRTRYNFPYGEANSASVGESEIDTRRFR